jgi:putative transposase
VKRGEKAGYPRFKSRRRFDSITFPSYGDGIKLNDHLLGIQGVGQVEVKLHRPVGGKIKTVTIKRACGKWYACFSVECEAKALPANTKAIGIDVGLTAFATMSDGKSVPNNRWYQRAEAKLRRAQRKVARGKKGSRRRRKAVVLLQKVHQRIKNQRHEFQHKFTFWLVQNFGVIAVENLHVKGLAGGMLAKSVHDVSWAAFFSKLAYRVERRDLGAENKAVTDTAFIRFRGPQALKDKAESAGRVLKTVNPCGTSQTCTCGAKVWKELSDREHLCAACGLIAPRDVVSAQVILQRARMSPSNRNVAERIACVVLRSRRIYGTEKSPTHYFAWPTSLSEVSCL